MQRPIGIGIEIYRGVYRDRDRNLYRGLYDWHRGLYKGLSEAREGCTRRSERASERVRAVTSEGASERPAKHPTCIDDDRNLWL